MLAAVLASGVTQVSGLGITHSGDAAFRSGTPDATIFS
jgi:hypothetical protein